VNVKCGNEKNKEASTFQTGAVFEKRVLRGLRLLTDAYRYSLDLETNPDEFAVELRLLCAVDLTVIDLRWLQRKGFVRHLVEELPPLPTGRLFDAAEGLSFSDRSCFVLTKSGMELVQEMALAPDLTQVGVEGPKSPRWDVSRRELLWGGTLVKKFRVPAPNQELILDVLEEEGWPCRIDDPLRLVNGVEPKRRLHDTIVALNRHHIQPIVRFSGDGTGQGLLWKLIATQRQPSTRLSPDRHQITGSSSR
jgi:hypothetical protein